MAVHRCNGRGEQNRSNNDEDNRERAAEPETSTVKFAEQEENAERGDNRGAHKAANGAAPAGATDLVAHAKILLREGHPPRRTAAATTSRPSVCGTSKLPRQSKRAAISGPGKCANNQRSENC